MIRNLCLDNETSKSCSIPHIYQGINFLTLLDHMVTKYSGFGNILPLLAYMTLYKLAGIQHAEDVISASRKCA